MPSSPLFRRALAAVLTMLLVVGLAETGAGASVGGAHRAGADNARLVVEFRAPSAAANRRALDWAGARRSRTIPQLGLEVLTVPAGDIGRAVARLRASAAVAHVEVDAPVHAADVVPNDPEWQRQWGQGKVRAPTAWETTLGDPSVAVAVLDSGVDLTHPDLAGALVPGTDLVNSDPDPSDDHGHGTSVAGVIGARTDNGVGIASYCWRCSLMPVKVLGADGSGSMSTVAEGITWAVDHGARVVNLSLGGTGGSSAVERAVAYARGKGAVVVAAAGNEGSTAPSYPAAYPGVIAVAGTDASDIRYGWSNHGSWVDVAAPGCHVATGRAATYGSFCGTSSAAPAVAAIAGLALASRLSAVGAEVEEAILSSAVPVGSFVTRGRVDAAGALEGMAMPAPQATVPDAPTGVGATAGNTSAIVTWTPPVDDGGSPVTGYRVTSSPGGMTVTGAAGESSARFAGLANGTSYTFAVVARNGVGESQEASSGSPVTPSLDAVERVAGDTRIETAVALSERSYQRAQTVTLARVDAYADALAAAPLAAQAGAPILLTTSDALAPPVAAEVRRLGARTAQLVGGTTALGPGVEAGLRDAGVSEIVRIAGEDRFDTARLIAGRVGGSSVYVTEGANADASRGWPDAVAVSGLAAFERRPILLVTRDTVPAATRAALVELGATSATIVGGAVAVADVVAAGLTDPDGDGVGDVAVTRLAGASRYETSRAVADRAVAVGAAASRTWLATGLSWPDALAAGPAVGAAGGVLLLVDGRDLAFSPSVEEWLRAHGARLTELVLVGGPASISSAVETQLTQLLP